MFIETNLDALKTAASSGNMEPVTLMSLGRSRSSSEWYKNQLTFKLRVKDPLITKQSEQFVVSIDIIIHVIIINNFTLQNKNLYQYLLLCTV